MSKKRIIILAGLLIVSFGGSFVLSWWLSPPPEPETTEEDAVAETPGAAAVQASLVGQPASLRLDEVEADKLIKKLRNLIEQNKVKSRKLEEWKQQLDRTKAELKSQAQHLEALRVQLVAPLDRLKRAQKELESARIRVRAEELANLRFTAETFDKMAPEESAPILVAMVDNGQLNDAVKIFRFMSERIRAKVLEAIGQAAKGNTGPAATLVDGLTRVQQEK